MKCKKGIVVIEFALVAVIAIPLLLLAFQIAWSMNAKIKCNHLVGVAGIRSAAGATDAEIMADCAPLADAMRATLTLTPLTARAEIDATLFVSSMIAVETPRLTP